ncbi:MAG: hypothetical protein H8E26_05980 [FCB group bacterium]|nr:hypothetical protein [FCB group bacterium]MBL7027844.1 hypothetical protein [Candidatus Neomarinimicrobiota bacterium]MBL7120925.1 hypothetical protein [Candidatus Neomarinimicrobiota bacterium]
MKKTLVLGLILLVAITSLYATNKRVQALGNNAYMLPGDDASIQLFPQRINDMNLIYFEDIHLGSPNYLLVVGDSAKSWGFYGGSVQQDDYFNIIKTLGGRSAVRMGVRFGITSQTGLDDDNETTPTTSEEKLSQTNIMLDLEYGLDTETMELSTSIAFGMTPGTINSLLGFAPTPHGSFTGDYESGGSSTSSEGKASKLSFALQVKSRSNSGLLFFDNSYAVFGLAYQGGSSEYTSANTKLEDESGNQFAINSTYRVFNNQNLADDKIFLVYGLGGSLFFSRTADEGKLSGSESKDTDMSFGIFAPIMNIGLEAKLKYTTLRFGMERQITTLGFTSTKNIYVSGSVDDEDTFSTFTLGGNGVYNYNAGMGFNYGDLQLDILINNTFWITGPQMIFNDLYGTLGVCADLVYTF